MRTGVSPKRIATRNLKLSLSNGVALCVSATRKILLSFFVHALIPSLSIMLCIISRSVTRHMASFVTPHLPVQARHLSPAKNCRMDSLTTRQQSNPYFFFLRKEVIQPHLPIRLPCYDFTPVISPTYDSSLPKGLGHWLRAFPTPMV